MKKTLIALALATTAASAHAGLFMIDIGYDGNGNGSTFTAPIDTLNFNATLATSVYTTVAPTLTDPLGLIGSTVTDSNLLSVLNPLGFTPGNHITVNGSTLTANGFNAFRDPLVPGDNNIDVLNTPGSTDHNGYTNVVSLVGGTGFGFTDMWMLTYDYVLNGTLTSTGVDFNSGYFDIFFNNTAGSAGVLGGPTDPNRVQVGRLNVNGSQTTGVSLLLDGNFSFDFNGDGTDDSTTFAQNFWFDIETGQTFYDAWTNGIAINPIAINFLLSTEVRPAIPTADQLVLDAGTGNLIRQTQLNGNISFEVPEPFTLSLIGLGLLGLAASRRLKG